MFAIIYILYASESTMVDKTNLKGTLSISTTYSNYHKSSWFRRLILKTCESKTLLPKKYL